MKSSMLLLLYVVHFADLAFLSWLRGYLVRPQLKAATTMSRER